MTGPLSYSLMEAANLLGLDPGKSGQAGRLRLYKMYERGELRAFKVGRVLRLSHTEVQRLIDSDARAAS